MNEFETSNGRGCFLTLTYSNEFLPVDFSLHKDDLQKFFKRLRKRLGDQKIKYYACGEYGDKQKIYVDASGIACGRPHYHAIVFGLSVMDAMIVLPDVWKFGFFKIMPVFYESCRYVCDYVMKKYNGDKALQEYGQFRQIPFRLGSQGLGKDYAVQNRERIEKNLGVCVGGKNKGLPKYYKRLYQKEDLSDVADWFTRTDATLEEFNARKAEVLDVGVYKKIKDKAIERDKAEKEAYDKFLADVNPDSIVDYPVMDFESWQESVRKLRDLTVKAKAKLKERKI